MTSSEDRSAAQSTRDLVTGRERDTDHEIEPLIYERWSPRAMSGEPVPRNEIMRLFEAARWAPSSFNSQPWRFLYALRDTEHWPLFFDLLNKGNRSWVENAAALIVILSRTESEDARPLPTHSFDTGAAWQNLALQGATMGLAVHGLAGFDYDRAREVLHIPDDIHIEAMIAVGRPGPLDELSERLRDRERPRSRLPVDEIAIEGPFA